MKQNVQNTTFILSEQQHVSNLFKKKIDFVQYINDDHLKFFFFGCWNNDLNVTNKVIDNIIHDNSIQFGIVNGDNYYSKKIEQPNSINKNNKKVEIHDLTQIDRGFNILKRFNKNIYLTLGNHEVDQIDKLQTCAILLKELQVIENTNIQIPNNYYSITFICKKSSTGQSNQTHKIKLVFLDTNLMDSNKCYNENSRIEDMSNMINWLNDTINKTSSDCGLIIVGHLPLFHLRLSKKDKTKYKISLVKKMILIFNILKNIHRNVYYLTSDTHNYQYITHKNITEIIIGTAGADLDMIKTIDQPIGKFINGISEKFVINKSKSEHGHIVLTINESHVLEHEFISIGNKNIYSNLPIDKPIINKPTIDDNSEILDKLINNKIGGKREIVNNELTKLRCDNSRIAHDKKSKEMRKILGIF